MQVYTTIDSRMQHAAEAALTRTIASGKRQTVGNGALVSLETGAGYGRAVAGGIDCARSPFNRVLQAHRQPGSTFKVFVYMAALEARYALTDTVLDAPVTVGRWSPKNCGLQYRGRVTLQSALAYSFNSAAVRMCLEVSQDSVAGTAHRAGISSPLTTTPAIALGVSEVTSLIWRMPLP